MKRKYRIPLDPNDPADPRHGTLNGYSNHHCPCQPCRYHGREYNRITSRIRRELGLAPDSHKHGSDAGYTNNGCRCEPCKAAHAAAKADYRDRKQREAAREPASVILPSWSHVDDEEVAA